MSWAVGEFNGRDIGYGVPAIYDHPDCNEEINRGLGYVCGSHVYGGENGCGLFFCSKHSCLAELGSDVHPQIGEFCERCILGKDPFEPKPDVPQWIEWKLTDESWQRWRDENKDEVERLRRECGV